MKFCFLLVLLSSLLIFSPFLLFCVHLFLFSSYRAAFTGAIFFGYTRNKANGHTRYSINFQLNTNMSQIASVLLQQR
jgi:hypothetical protein